MTKYLLLIVLGLCVWWIWRKLRQTDHTTPPRHGREAERMVQCARCGVNQPIGESILANGRYYCSAAHLRESRSDDV